ncbi:BZ3500_MvSof-1268-A1-R1_Chr1-1g01031 [Microbotryum saponariae]|uniref:BZ3500_MvSof-1268-A1-R1_Chr1-1g01031 protein n=1 Tax=Microbotryum saponariae TaxID=289078 RepID=A0A2X0M4U1_9BASI|nr:BZ3500_MvSof-1268-A1-R1_Chr1-1g01031 [Microbotryum saponariae]SCZ93233.1 BZ3501_MvSof-1269-A2-R1_Chr1-1g00628 [Microbotryum saponariae]
MPSIVGTPTRSPNKRRRTTFKEEENSSVEESPSAQEVCKMLLGTPRRTRTSPSQLVTPTKATAKRRSHSPVLKENVPVHSDSTESHSDQDELIFTPSKEIVKPEDTLPTPHSTPTKDRVTARPIKDIYTHALQLLSPSGSTLPTILGRDSQRATLVTFLARRFPQVYRDHPTSASDSAIPPASLYVSGPPGIGKTALLSAVVNEFSALVEQQDLEDEISVHMQTCQTSGATQSSIWDRLGRGLGLDMSLGTGHAKFTSKQAFERGLARGGSFLIILDEIDHLHAASASANLLQSLVTLAHAPNSSLTLIGIANTLDLMTRYDLASSASLVPSWKKGRGTSIDTPTMQQLHFKAYNASEIELILRQRLSMLADSYPLVPDLVSPPAPSSRTIVPLLHPAALKLCAMKVAARSGDIRQAFRVVEMCVSSLKRKARGSLGDGPEAQTLLSSHTPETAPKASPSDINLSLKDVGLSVSAELASQLSTLQRNARFVLVSICIALSRESLAGFEAKALNRTVNVSSCYAVYQEMLELDEVFRRSANLSRGDWVDAQGLVEANAFVRSFSTQGAAKGRKPKGSPTRRSGADAADPMLGLSSYGLDEVVDALKTVPAAEGMSAGVLEDTLRISKMMLHWEEERVSRERNKKMFEQQRDRSRDHNAPSEGFHGLGLEKGPASTGAGKNGRKAQDASGLGKWIGKKRKVEDEDEVDRNGLVVGEPEEE